MGMMRKLVLECDGDGCDLRNERGENDPTYDGIQHLTMKINSDTLWDGWLCAPCEKKLWDKLKAQMPKPRTNEQLKETRDKHG